MAIKHPKHLQASVGDEIHVKDVMTKNPTSVQKFENIVHVAQILSEKNISGIPVVDKQNHVIGIITQADVLAMIGIRKEHTFKDLLKHALGEPKIERKRGDIVADIMTTPSLTTSPDSTIAEVVQVMDEKKVRRLPVVDDKQKLVGIISRADILKAVLRKLK